METTEKTLVDTIVVKQDIGVYEPRHKRAILQFWADGTVTWRPPSAEESGSARYSDLWVGEPAELLDLDDAV